MDATAERACRTVELFGVVRDGPASRTVTMTVVAGQDGDWALDVTVDGQRQELSGIGGAGACLVAALTCPDG